jgi:parallel beta-helix repeat protein
MQQRWASGIPLRVILAGAIAILVTTMLPAPAVAAGLSCGAILTQNTRLDRDLSCVTGDGLVVGADNIVLNLNGHAISGPATFASGAGVRVAFHHGVHVRNGSIRGFTEGVVLDNASAARVGNLVLTDNLRGVNLAISSGNLVERNVIARSGLDGIRLGFSSGNRIEGNILTNNVFGINVADFSNDNRIARNRISTSRDLGIGVVTHADRNTITGNWVSGGAVDGITVTFSSNDTTVSQNSSIGNGRDGFLVDASSRGTVLRRNMAHANADDGIEVDSAMSTLTRNTGNGNRDLGIEAVSGVVDGGGNTAAGNGNPAQCTGVTCTSTPSTDSAKR